MAQEQTPTEFFSLAALGFPGFEHSLVAAAPRGTKTVWLRRVGEKAVQVEVASNFLELMDRFAA